MEYVIIGNSAAGIGASEAIRQVDKTGKITIVGDESYHSYSRPLISHFLAGEMKEEDVFYREKDFYIKNNIDTLLGKKAISINTGTQNVTLNDGKKLNYDRLLIATGTLPSIPKIKGMDSKGVFTFRTLNDAKDISIAVKKAKSAVVIGAGLIGMRALYALYEIGLKVSVVEILDRVLGQILDKQGSKMVKEILKNHGLKVFTGTGVKEISSGKNGVREVVLDNGEKIKCELVIIATGIKPNTEIINGTSISASIGILTDKYMRTSVPNIYAAGDVALPHDISLGEYGPIPNLPNAHEQGLIAGKNMSGVLKQYDGGIRLTSIEFFGIPCISLGIVDSQDGDEEYQKIQPLTNAYRKILIKRNVIVGAIFIGNIKGAGFITNLIKKKIGVGDIKGEIIREGKRYMDFLHQLRKEDMEGDIEWKKQIGMEMVFRKKFDESSWTEKEKGRR